MIESTDLSKLLEQAQAAFVAAHAPADLENAKSRFLGKTGALTELMKRLAVLPAEDKREFGARMNACKQAIEASLEQHRQRLRNQALSAQLLKEKIDVTLPGRKHTCGSAHPVSRTLFRVEQIFRSMGFDVADGPEIEEDWYNFTALNMPQDHPARSMHDTFYLNNGQWLLRTHTSPMQIRYGIERAKDIANNKAKEIRVIAHGKTYRVDSDATHSPMFHQCEGLWLSDQVSFVDLKSTFTYFLQAFFETEQLMTRFRPSFFPFTEPSAEIDLMFLDGPLQGQWLEVAGSGQVHPQVVKNLGLDPEQYIGFAFGAGMERLTMLRYGINDLRLFFDNDLRFLRQFSE